MKWYYLDGDQEVGPISKAELRDLLQAGRINGKTRVRNAQMNEWRSLAEMANPGMESRSTQALFPSPPDLNETIPLVPMGATQSDTRVPFQFKGTGGEYFRVWIVNILLSIVTFGIYSAWAKVRRKQYFYANTHVAGSAFRYLADPMKILKGRVVVFLGFCAFSIVNELLPAVGFFVVIGFFGLLPWLVVRSLTFNARNSALRNIRFNFTGKYWEAVKVYVLLPILAVFTLGILYPYVLFRQKKFIVEHSAYGTTPFRFHAKVADYYRICFALCIPTVIVLAIAALITYAVWQGGLAMTPAVLAVPLMLTLLYLYAIAFYSVKSNNLLYNSGALLRHRFKATMTVKPYTFILLTNMLATVLTLGFFYPFATVRTYRYKINQLALLPGGDLEQFVAAEGREASALGDEITDFMGFDFGL